MPAVARRLSTGLAIAIALLAIACGAAVAATVPPSAVPLTGSNFEGGDAGVPTLQVDGLDTAQKPNGAGRTDWTNVAGLRTIDDPEALDTMFEGGDKELAPGDWNIITKADGVTPGKDNIQAVWVATEPSPSGTFLYAALKREKSDGDTFLTFELNQVNLSWDPDAVNPSNSLIPCRTTGDVLLAIDVTPAGTPFDIVPYIWTTTSSTAVVDGDGVSHDCARTGTVALGNPSPVTDAQGSANWGPKNAKPPGWDGTINNYLSPGTYGSTFSAGTFAEIALNVTRILDEFANGDPCTSFGALQVHSRSAVGGDSGNIATSQLQDLVGPVPLAVRNCGVIGNKFNDLNGNGAWDKPAEPGLGGWIIYADLDDNGVRDAGEPFDITAADGSYDIGDVKPAGNHAVREEAPAGSDPSWTCTYPAHDAALPGSDDKLKCGHVVGFTTGTQNKDTNGNSVDFGNFLPSGKLEVKKVLVPSTDGGKFNLLIDGNAEATDVGNNGSTGEKTVATGTHTVGESQGTATTLGDYSSSVECRGSNGAGAVVASNAGGSGVTVNVTQSSDIVCVITNTKHAKVITKKIVNSLAHPGQTFTFTGAALASTPATLGNNDTSSRTVTAFPATLTSSEDVPAGWDATVKCSGDNDSSGSGAAAGGTATATFKPDPGETITCTFANTERAKLITKKVVNSLANPNAKFTFNGDALLSTPVDLGNDDTSVKSISAFQDYQSSEARQNGWSTTASCAGDLAGGTASTTAVGANAATATFKPDPGETITCTFTNTENATLTTKKLVVSAASPGQKFTFTGTALASTPVSLGNNDTSTSTITSFGATYGSAEARQAGWATTVACTGDLAGGTASSSAVGANDASATFAPDPGEHLLCTFTNAQGAAIEIEKQTSVQGDPKQFTFTPTASLGAAFQLADDGVKTLTNVTPNAGGTAYTVTEATTIGYRLTGVSCGNDDDSSGDVANRRASIHVSAGETAHCTFTNLKLNPSIAIVKTGTAEAHHGDTLSFQFAVTNNGNSPEHDVVVSDDHCSPVTGPTDKQNGNQDGVLDPGETWIYTCSYKAPADHVNGEANPIHNVATVNAKDEQDQPVTAQSAHDTLLLHPAIHVAKKASVVTAHVGDTVTYTFTVVNTGDTPLGDVALSDAKCDAGTISAPSGDANKDSKLDLAETWTYTCRHKLTADDADPFVNVATAAGKDPLGLTVSDDDTATVDVIHPAVDIAKTGPAAATAGERIKYTLVVTNPGDVALVGQTLSVTDKLCDAPPLLIAKARAGGADPTPDALDPGDAWVYECSVPTAAGQTEVDNTADVTGFDPLGAKVTDSAQAKTVLGQIEVLPEVVVSGASKLSGPSACVNKAFKVKITGRRIAKVTFKVDGKTVKTLRNAAGAGRKFTLRIDPRRYGAGVHRLKATVTYAAASKTAPRTLQLAFEKCRRQVIAPQFTG